MAKKDRTFVTYENLLEIEREHNPNYMIVFGGRNDGKSYAAKEKVLRDFFDHGAQFTYLRRYDIDIKTVDNTLYWADFTSGKKNKVMELSGKAWNDITYEKGVFYLGLTENGKTERGPVIGYAHALSVSEKRYKSLQFPDVENVIYEEFCSADVMLYNEVKIFMNYISTINRGRRINVYMIGNTVSRHNAYFREWQLENIPKQKPGTVDVYYYKTEEGNEIVIACYYTTTEKDNTMFFGSSAKMIQGGEWDSDEQPHLKHKEEEYEEVYRCIFMTDSLNKYLCRFMVREDVGVWYITAKTTDPKPEDRVISPEYVESIRYTNNFIPLNDHEKKLFSYLSLGRICYGDNLTGTEFKRALKQLKVLNN